MPHHSDAQYHSSFFDLSVQMSSPGNGSCVREIFVEQLVIDFVFKIQMGIMQINFN